MKTKKNIIIFMAFLAILSGLVGYKVISNRYNSNDKDSKIVEKNSVDKYIELDETNKEILANVEPIARNNKEEVVTVESVQEPKISPSTRLVYQNYYTLDDRILEEETEPPYYMLGMTREQLDEYYPEYQLIAFSATNVVLRKAIEDYAPGYYIIQDFKGKIGIFFDYRRNYGSDFEEVLSEEELKVFTEEYLREIIETPISSLAEEEQNRLKVGITVYGYDNLISIIENYSS